MGPDVFYAFVCLYVYVIFYICFPL